MLRPLNKNNHILFDRNRLCYPRRFKHGIGDFAALRIREKNNLKHIFHFTHFTLDFFAKPTVGKNLHYQREN
jgi:hypothetical protein